MIVCPSRVVPCKNIHLQYLCERMRPDEIENLLALTGVPTYIPDVAACALMMRPGIKMTLLNSEGLPVVAGGYEETKPGVCSGWMIGSMQGWKTEWRSITKGVLWLIDHAFLSGIRRMEIETITTRTAAMDWYARLGFSLEGIRKKYGAGGEDVGIYARVST